MPFTGYEVIKQKRVITFLTYSSFRAPETYLLSVDHVL